MQKKNFLTTGEFARLCKTTKETLFHYDRENLLKPRHVTGKGYRRYAMEQLFDFDMITMLKETGSSLKEIGHHIHNADGVEFLSLLEKKRRVVKEERARLARRERMLEDMVALTREALEQEFDVLLFADQQEEHLEILPTVPVVSESTEEYVVRYADYVDFYDKEGRTPRSPFGAIVALEDVTHGRYAERWFFSRATRATPRALRHVKPGGRYAVLAHMGTAQAHKAVFRNMLQGVAGAGLRPDGNAYVYDFMSYILLGAGESYAAKYCLPVKPA